MSIGDEFNGFTLHGVHSSKYCVYLVAGNGAYSMPMFSNFTDKTANVDGFNGTYYFGTDYTGFTTTIDCAIYEADENTLRDIQRWLAPNKIGKFTFDYSPYKYYTVKVSSTPEFIFQPFDDGFGGNLYNGTISIQLTAYYPFASSYFNTLEGFDYVDDSDLKLYYDSGILYQNQSPPSVINNITEDIDILLYNGGNAKTKPVININGSADLIAVTNLTTNQNFALYGLEEVENLIIDCQKGQVVQNGFLVSGYHNGGYIELEGSDRIDTYNDIIFSNGSKNIVINKVDFNIVGRFIFANEVWYEVLDCDFKSNKLTLDKAYIGNTQDIHTVTVMDLNKIKIAGLNMNISSIEFNYKYVYL